MGTWNNFEAALLEEENRKILDKIDFTPYFIKSNNYAVIKNMVEDDYDDSNLTDNDICEGYIFNQLDDSQIIVYLQDRYGENIHCREITTTYIDYDGKA